MDYINIVKGDLYRIRFHITNQDDEVVNLTDADITLKAISKDGTTIVNGTCESISDDYPLISGYCCYQVKSSDFANTGLYDAEIEIKWNITGNILTCPNLEILVLDEL